ncbi:hypothetical protein NIES4075_72100 [Tolypothrix sp. NIES-4075]|nr:hypothetical protein NIES4075_72100 [Tolypothrix sp. NIES-4075]
MTVVCVRRLHNSALRVPYGNATGLLDLRVLRLSHQTSPPAVTTRLSILKGLLGT